MAGRFIKLYEQIVNWEWFKYPNTLCLFIYLLLKANYCDLDLHGRTIRRGQMVTTLTGISTGTGLSIQQVRTSLKHLISTGEVTDESNNQYRVITVVKYDEYQNATGKSTGNQQATNRQPNRQLTGNSTDDLTPSIEYIENNRNIEDVERIENKALPHSGKDPFLENSFNAFWACYPKKVDKQEAKKAWRKIKPNAELADEIMSGLQKWTESYDWLKDDGRYIPYPATWLNKRRWEDEPLKMAEPSRSTTAPMKRVIAQDYSQRDYSHVDDDIMADVAKDMELFKAGGGVW